MRKEWRDVDIAETDIAVVGMACRVPGARNIDEFWRVLRDGVECVTQFSDEELLEAGVDPSALKSPNYVKSGTVLDDVENWDAGFFGFSPRDAAIMDPQHRHFLECCWEAFEHAGHVPSAFDGSVGVFAGCGVNAYFMYNILTNPQLLKSVGFFLLRHTGNDKDFLATRVSYQFNLKGPSVNVQTACSTSLVAIHTAVQSLLNGECDMALAGGVTIETPHRRGYEYQEGEILSPDGHCRAFDARSQGTIFGSGAGAVVLRRLEDAINDGDVIHAVIKGSAINNDGSDKVGYLAPSVEGQAAAISEALSIAGVSAEEVGYVEAHGTGTPVGDPIEVAALTQAFRQSTEQRGYCGIGSVKTNIGHLDTAAGVVGFIKVVLALKNKKLPPSLNYESPNPKIDFDSSPFFVNADLTDWDGLKHPRTAGISSLGVGGTNAHVVLREAVTPAAAAATRRRAHVLLLSAKSDSALEEATTRMAARVRGLSDAELADVAFTTQVGRERFQKRRVLVCRSADDAVAAIEANDRSRLLTHSQRDNHEPSVVFMFAGGGVQYPNMGLQLYQEESVYREELDRCFAIVDRIVDWDLKALMFPAPDDVKAAAKQLQSPMHSILSIFVTEYALAKLWMSWGVEPAAMTGHSLGEYAAACLAGVMTLDDAIALVHRRGVLFDKLPEGGMLGVPLPESRIREILGDDVSIAALNAPELSVISGTTDEISAAEEVLARAEVDSNRIRISVAAHSAMLEPFLEEFASFARTMKLSPPERPYISNLTGTWVRAEDATDPEYWTRHLRQTVRFSDGVKELLQDSNRVFLEVGPGSTLSSLTRQHLSGPPGMRVISSMRHPKEEVCDLEFLLAGLGRLWMAGCRPDWSRFHGSEARRRVPIPTYPFQRERYWTEPGIATAAQEETSPTLEKIEDLSEWTYTPQWRETSRTNPAEPAQPQKILAFASGGKLQGKLLTALRDLGHDVVSVVAGDSFYKVTDTEYTIAVERADEYEQLVAELAASEQLPDTIVHLLLLTEDEWARPGSSFFHRNQEQGFYSLLYLMQALGGEGSTDALRLAVVTNGMHEVFEEGLPYPEKATVTGPCRVIPREFPHVSSKSIDLHLPELGLPRFASTARRRKHLEYLTTIARDCTQEENGTYAYREGRRWEQHYERTPVSVSETTPASLRDGEVYLISGGLGGLGLVHAECIARTVKAKIALLGRSALPPRDGWNDWLDGHSLNDTTSRKIRKILALEELGCEVLPLAADVSNVPQMEAVLQQVEDVFGTIDGVLHTAGVLDDGLIQTKDSAAVERVFASKVHGTVVLERLLARFTPRFMVLFSSTSAIMGPAGQIDYAGANAFLCAFAQSRRQSPTHTVAINWGIWKDVGLAANTLAEKTQDPYSVVSTRMSTTHPLLDECLLDTTEERLFGGTYSPKKHWILSEHRTKDGRAIVPGTGYLEIALAALRNGDTEAAELSDIVFLSPLEVADGRARDVRVRLQRDIDTFSFEVVSRTAGSDASDWQPHAQGHVRTSGNGQSPTLSLDEIESRCGGVAAESNNGDSLTLKQEDHLDFGPRWRVLKRTRFGDKEAVARLELAAEFEGDLKEYSLHPALLDMATGFAMPLISGYDTCTDLYIPLAYKHVRVHAPLERTILSHVRSRGANSVESPVATFDITITSTDGRVLVEIEGFSMKRLEHGTGLPTSDSRRDAESTESRGSLTPQEEDLKRMLQEGISATEGTELLQRILAEPALPQVVVSSMDLHGLVAQIERTQVDSQSSGEKFSRPKLDSQYAEPRNAVERTLVSDWEELLGVDRIGIHDNFFELGGYSLIAVRLVAKIKKQYGIEYPLSMLFEAPTVAECAELIIGEVGDGDDEDVSADAKPAKKREHSLLVPLHRNRNASRAPFFMVAGMYGNVMNLRHFASHLHSEQPFYGIQARGLLGETEPHNRFAPMAKDYLEQIRRIQPQGPYFLGGFSGGGVTAYEMAVQLRAAGEEVALLVLLDTPSTTVPTLSKRDRVLLLKRRLIQIGPRYFLDGVRKKLRIVGAALRERQERKQAEQRPSDFRSEQVGDAFTEAVHNYVTPKYAGNVVLYRPPLDQSFELEPHRWVNVDGGFVDHFNFWGEFINDVEGEGGLDVEVVTGDHDSMVLEPHVRVLAEKLTERIAAAVKTIRRGSADDAHPHDSGLAPKKAGA